MCVVSHFDTEATQLGHCPPGIEDLLWRQDLHLPFLLVAVIGAFEVQLHPPTVPTLPHDS
jgi:hypothetical protein